MESWESLIAARMRPCATIVPDVDTSILRRRIYNRARYHRIKDNPGFKENKKAVQRIYRHSDKYRKHHAKEMREWRAKKKQLTINTKEA